LQDSNDPKTTRLEEALIELALESWKFSRLFARLADKLGEGEAARYRNQHRYFLKRLEESLHSAGLRLVNLEDRPYDPGEAVTALNLGDFGPDDSLLVGQMVEPIIMNPQGLLRAGTVMLRKTTP
jgi:hypothetical protein